MKTSKGIAKKKGMAETRLVCKPLSVHNERRRRAGRAVELALVVLIIGFCLSFWILFAFRPRPLQSIGPDGRPTGRMSSKRTALASLVAGLVITVVILATVAVAYVR
jgi:hypothetical protein